MNALRTCADIFKPVECENYFKASGYEYGLIGKGSKRIGAVTIDPSSPPTVWRRGWPLGSLKGRAN